MSLSVRIPSLLQWGTLFLCVAAILTAKALAESSPLPTSPLLAAWEKPRTLSDFQPLLHHSPFSLPTAEESSPLADRYALTGIVTIGGDEEIFIFDRTDQSREILTHTPNIKNMSLVTLVREAGAAPQKATIRVGGDTGTISYLEAAPQAPGSQTARPPHVQLPALPQLPRSVTPSQPAVPSTPQTHRSIRRPMVTPPPSQVPTP